MLSFSRKPSVDLNKNGKLRIFFHQRKYNFVTNVELNRWYNISIEQNLFDLPIGFSDSLELVLLLNSKTVAAALRAARRVLLAALCSSCCCP